MSTDVGDHYLAPYLRAADEHGSAFAVTQWYSERSQRLRFSAMTRMLYMAGKRVLDVGCSRGDFAAYLLETGLEYDSFVGVDAVPSVIDFAAQRGLARCRFLAGDVLEDRSLLKAGSPQVITMSGTLNTMSIDTALELLECAWDAAGQAMVFNFLSDQATPEAPKQSGPARRLPTLRLLEWAMSRTPAVKLAQDYFRFGHDATIAMRKT